MEYGQVTMQKKEPENAYKQAKPSEFSGNFKQQILARSAAFQDMNVPEYSQKITGK